MFSDPQTRLLAGDDLLPVSDGVLSEIQITRGACHVIYLLMTCFNTWGVDVGDQ